jgi:hypothetical protein
VRYRLDYRASVRDYLRDLPLTRAGKVRVNAAIIQMAGEVSDSFRSDPANRLGPSPYYHFTFIFSDGGRLWRLFVVVDDSTAVYGVLRIVYADCQ